jgi:hypothetical protein
VYFAGTGPHQQLNFRRNRIPVGGAAKFSTESTLGGPYAASQKVFTNRMPTSSCKNSITHTTDYQQSILGSVWLLIRSIPWLVQLLSLILGAKA